MPPRDRPIILATRGSPLALAQAHGVLAQCRAAFPELAFELSIIKTTGDKMQTASMAQPGESLPKGLFTKELEVALLREEADLAVHSLKDLPTDLPDGLILGAVGLRADVRDVLVYRASARATAGAAASSLRGFAPGLTLAALPPGAVVATSSTRRREQVLAAKPDLRTVEIRGNVGTRLQKVAQNGQIDATILAAAGLGRLGFRIHADGRLEGPLPTPAGSPASAVPAGLLAVFLEVEVMLPCAGQAAVGIETRANDARLASVCARLDHRDTHECVAAERAFLRAMGGGCQSPVAAYAEVAGASLRLRAVSFHTGRAVRGEEHGPAGEPVALGERVAAQLKRLER
jgi:hydroxymethylbilane synthase